MSLKDSSVDLTHLNELVNLKLKDRPIARQWRYPRTSEAELGLLYKFQDRQGYTEKAVSGRSAGETDRPALSKLKHRKRSRWRRKAARTEHSAGWTRTRQLTYELWNPRRKKE